MVASDTRYFMTFFVCEIGQLRLFDEAKGVLMMPTSFNEHTRIVQKRSTLQEAQSMIIQLMQWSRYLNKLCREACRLTSMRPIFDIDPTTQPAFLGGRLRKLQPTRFFD